MIGLHDPGGTGDPAVGDLYAVGWRAVGRPRQWVMAVYSSVEAAAEARHPQGRRVAEEARSALKRAVSGGYPGSGCRLMVETSCAS